MSCLAASTPFKNSYKKEKHLCSYSAPGLQHTCVFEAFPAMSTVYSFLWWWVLMPSHVFPQQCCTQRLEGTQTTAHDWSAWYCDLVSHEHVVLVGILAAKLLVANATDTLLRCWLEARGNTAYINTDCSPCHADFFKRKHKINIFLIIYQYWNGQVFKLLPQTCPTQLISLLLMLQTWSRNEPGHQQ